MYLCLGVKRQHNRREQKHEGNTALRSCLGAATRSEIYHCHLQVSTCMCGEHYCGLITQGNKTEPLLSRNQTTEIPTTEGKRLDRAEPPVPAFHTAVLTSIDSSTSISTTQLIMLHMFMDLVLSQYDTLEVTSQLSGSPAMSI